MFIVKPLYLPFFTIAFSIERLKIGSNFKFKFFWVEEWRSCKALVKAHLHIRLLHAFSALHCNFYYLPWLRKNKESDENCNASKNWMCKLSLTHKHNKNIIILQWCNNLNVLPYVFLVNQLLIWKKYAQIYVTKVIKISWTLKQ